jgi:hypothetical protein
LASGIAMRKDVATVSSEVFYVGDSEGRALRLDIVATQQSLIPSSTSSEKTYVGTSKYMSKECNDLLKSINTPDLVVRNNRAAKLYLRHQEDGSVVMDACYIVPYGPFDQFDWVRILVNISWTTTGYNDHKVSIRYSGLPGIGGVTNKGAEGLLPPSNFMLFDYTVVSDTMGDWDSTSLMRLDQTIDKYVQAIQTLHYNNDTIWRTKMGLFEMTVTQFSMVGATRIELPYVIIVATLGCLGVLATLLNKFVLNKYYADSFPLNVASSVAYKQTNSDSYNVGYSLVQLDPSSEKTLSIQLNNRVLCTECCASSTESPQSQSLLNPDNQNK